MGAPVFIATVRLGEFFALATACMTLSVSSAGLLREAPHIDTPKLVPEKAKPALVKLDPTKLLAPTQKTAPDTPSLPTPDAAVAPTPLAPVASLPNLNLPDLPQVPTVNTHRKQPIAKTASAKSGTTNSNTTGGSGIGAANSPTVLSVADMVGRQPWPQYPYECLRRRESGVVKVQFEVDRNGNVSRTRVRESSNCERLDDAATETIQQRWKFPPGEPRLYEISIHFQLK